METNLLKDLWLRVYRATGDRKVATDRIGRPQTTVEWWIQDDAAFRAERDKIAETWHAILSDDFKALGVEALDTVRDLLEYPWTSDELKFKISQWILKTQNVGMEKADLRQGAPAGGGGRVNVTVNLPPMITAPTPTSVALTTPVIHMEPVDLKEAYTEGDEMAREYTMSAEEEAELEEGEEGDGE